MSHLLGIQDQGCLRGGRSACSVVATSVFRLVLPWSSVSSDPIGDGGSGVVGLGALSSVKSLSSPSPSDERSRFSARGSMSLSLLVSVLSFVSCCWLTQPNVTILFSPGDTCSR